MLAWEESDAFSGIALALRETVWLRGLPNGPGLVDKEAPREENSAFAREHDISCNRIQMLLDALGSLECLCAL